MSSFNLYIGLTGIKGTSLGIGLAFSTFVWDFAPTQHEKSVLTDLEVGERGRKAK